MHASTTSSMLQPDAVVLAVYAPFGADATLSTYPDGVAHGIADHPLVLNLRKVAQSGVAVSALVDLYDDATYQVDIPADRPEAMIVTPYGKMDMVEPRTLTALLIHAHQFAMASHVVLAIEGHGAGYLPDLDLKMLAQQGPGSVAPGTGHGGSPVLPIPNPTSGGGTDEATQSPVLPIPNPTSGVSASAMGHSPVLPIPNPTSHVSASAMGGSPVLPIPNPTSGSPTLPIPNPTSPIPNPTSPTSQMVISTWGLGAAFRAAEAASVPKLAAIHFNNCFNMSVEVLHTVAPHAEFATGYCNYNFFTAGQAYPAVFERFATAGSATSEQLAKWFAAENHKVLAEAGHEPTVAGTVELSRMRDIAEKVDDLSDALLAALRTASAQERPVVVARIKQAIVASQQYDSRGDYVLEAPDELTDLDSFATQLTKVDFGHHKVHGAAHELHSALSGIKQYGDDGTPWMATGDEWDFSSKNLAMNIFLPDPLLDGLWDWRSQYYLDVNPDPTQPQLQRHIIDFVKETDWVDFLREYHKGTPFIASLPDPEPHMPLLHSSFDPRHPDRTKNPRRSAVAARVAAHARGTASPGAQ